MNTDVATLQSIAATLEEEPMASQRVLAENAGMSIGLMNAVLKRFVERGWIMLTNVNMRKLAYAVTPERIAELTARSHSFAKRNFELANKYNDSLCIVGELNREEDIDRLEKAGFTNLLNLLNED
ncbi:MAG: winged helix-turn-helix transcriptional regulator [Clostridia bacterium]|nr:winged helix-turn-helix transcriptional regulator [Clostridia bacterium]